MFKVFVAGLLFMVAAAVNAVGPTLPDIPKYTSCGVRGNVTTIASITFGVQPSCPAFYEERTMKVFVSLDIGSVAVVMPDGMLDPDTASCIIASGLLVSPCRGDGQPICLLQAWVEDGTCETGLDGGEKE